MGGRRRRVLWWSGLAAAFLLGMFLSDRLAELFDPHWWTGIPHALPLLWIFGTQWVTRARAGELW